MGAAPLDLPFSKIISILENEASLVGGVRDELGEMQRELESMKAFLKDADRKGSLTEGQKTWVAGVRDVVYQVEDEIDKFVYHMNKQQGKGQFARFLHRTICLPRELYLRHHVAARLRGFNSRIKAISERRQRYGFEPTAGSVADGSQWLRRLRESSQFTSDDDLVGIDDDKESLLGWLTDEDSQRTVISVVGMGGSGKTTLVGQAYNSPSVKLRFVSCAWITVSQTYEIEELLRSMIREFYNANKESMPLNLNSMNYNQLVEMLVNHLDPKRYLLVLDDVWDTNLWNIIRVSLPDRGHGSRVLLTTRNEDIAASSFGVRAHVHHIKPLAEDDAWVLFCKKAFSSKPKKICPQHLETMGRELVRRCNGLPLAIVTLGGVVSSKQLEQWDWRRVCDGLNWELNNNPLLEAVRSILFLSFNDLPYRLKPCFLYCCIFPEDYIIPRKRLIRLWMAEGFVEEVGGLTPEEVADGYLMELIRRCMLQVVQSNPFGRPRRFKMHDLMRELALSTSKTEKFCMVHDGREEIEESGAHRLSIQTSDQTKRPSRGLSQLRSLFVFFRNRYSSSLSIKMPTGFRLLRVLDMQHVPIEILPDELVNLFNLRYLNLRGSEVKELPKSIGRLHNLQTLDIKRTNVNVLPIGIAKLRNLRFLSAYCYNYKRIYDFDFLNGVKAPLSITKLKNLQVLEGIESEGDILRQVKDMTQLKSFGIMKVREVDGTDLCAAIQRMSSLRFLSVKATNEEEVLAMDALSTAPPNLRGLSLHGKLGKVLHWFQSLQSLTRLVLGWSRLAEDPLPYIQDLPYLVWLELANAYDGEQLCFGMGFNRLDYLLIKSCPLLNEIIIGQGVMPSLQTLVLRNCLELKTLPRGIQHLTNLQELFLTDAAKELVESSTSGGERVAKVRHIPKIIRWNRMPSGLVSQTLL